MTYFSNEYQSCHYFDQYDSLIRLFFIIITAVVHIIFSSVNLEKNFCQKYLVQSDLVHLVSAFSQTLFKHPTHSLNDILNHPAQDFKDIS